ncbi:Wdr70 [Phodopus roborovskii]|uniref:WD repeat-containing protein 70 n=1 Tax=Phodopus roborovskii TaxID=109678 RepID=A0AAU9Z5V2_PHORO|nr:Wdr70 [Phodopus roborovskii]
MKPSFGLTMIYGHTCFPFPQLVRYCKMLCYIEREKERERKREKERERETECVCDINPPLLKLLIRYRRVVRKLCGTIQYFPPPHTLLLVCYLILNPCERVFQYPKGHPEHSLQYSHYSFDHYLIKSIVFSNPFVEELEKLIQNTFIPLTSSVHPKFHYKQAHDPGTDTSCVAFSYDGNVLASRGGDDTLKLWDVRQFNKPLFSASDLPTLFPMTDCCFSPDDKLIVTGTSVQRGCGNGKLVFFERRTFQRVYEIDITDAVCVFFFYLVSRMKGAKLCVVKTQRKAKQAETLTQDYIITPHALPMFREPRQRSTRKQLEKDRLDPLKSHKPEPPVAGPGRGGRVGTHGGTLSSYIVKNIALDKTDDSNPREAILRHAKAAEDNPYWVSPAYSKTQPKTMFAQVESDDEESKNEPEWKKRKI